MITFFHEKLLLCVRETLISNDGTDTGQEQLNSNSLGQKEMKGRTEFKRETKHSSAVVKEIC